MSKYNLSLNHLKPQFQTTAVLTVTST